MRRTTFMSMVAMALYTVFGSATFADIKAYHGAICGIPNGNETSTVTRDSGGVRNSSNLLEPQTVVVICPLIRDRIGSSTNLSGVVVEGTNLNGSLSCTLTSQTEDMGGGVVATQTRSTTTTGNVQLPTFSIPTSAGNEGAYSLRCTLGPGDAIYHVFVEELNGTD